MKKYMLFLSGIALFAVSCSKHGDKGGAPADPLKDSVVNIISFTGGDDYDPNDLIRSVSFLKYKEISTGVVNVGDCSLMYLDRTIFYPYKIRFLNSRHLIHPSKVYYAGARPGNIVVRFAINDSLLGKPILEVYDDDTKAVYRRIIAHPDSCAIEVFAGWVGGPGNLDTTAIRKRYEHLLDGIDTSYYEVFPGTTLP